MKRINVPYPRDFDGFCGWELILSLYIILGEGFKLLHSHIRG